MFEHYIRCISVYINDVHIRFLLSLTGDIKTARVTLSPRARGPVLTGPVEDPPTAWRPAARIAAGRSPHAVNTGVIQHHHHTDTPVSH